MSAITESTTPTSWPPSICILPHHFAQINSSLRHLPGPIAHMVFLTLGRGNLSPSRTHCRTQHLPGAVSCCESFKCSISKLSIRVTDSIYMFPIDLGVQTFFREMAIGLDMHSSFQLLINNAGEGCDELAK
ncbi:hypothetical protein LINPERPRIM_LOCUS40508 [Linum perenne]